MKCLPLISIAASSLFFSFALNGTEFLFNDADGLAVTSAENFGESSGEWNSNSPLKVEAGNLNIGFTENYKSNHLNITSGSDDIFTLDTAINSGKHI